MIVDFYFDISYNLSELITKKYSTSFSLASSLLEIEKRRAIQPKIRIREKSIFLRFKIPMRSVRKIFQ